MAQYDQLTGLPNRGFLQDRLKLARSTARRDRTGLSVLYLDLDKFKEVNDNLGHSVGDLMLQGIADRLKQCLRESDTVDRIGGDASVVLLRHIQGPAQTELIVEKIRSALSRPTIGRASRRERVSLYVLISVAAVSLKIKTDITKQ